MRRLGIGLISVGWMGRVHTRAYQALPTVYPELGVRPELVHVADVAPERTDYARDVLGYARASADFRELLADPEVDVVSICAPNDLHAEAAIAAAQAGKPFWVEKPAGRGAAETEAIAEAAARAGVATAVGFNYRCAPAIERARELIASGALGRITSVRGVFAADYSADPHGALTWRFVRERAGSGVLGDLLGHLVDLVHFTVGPVTEVAALTDVVHAERPRPSGDTASHFAAGGGEPAPVENEDWAGLLVRLATRGRAGADGVHGAAVGTLEASRVAVGRRAHYALEVSGTEGALTWDFERMNELRVAIGVSGPSVGFTTIQTGPGMGEFARFQPGAGTAMGYDDLKVIEAARFVGAVLGDPHPLGATIRDAVAANRVLAAAEEADARRAWVDVATDADRHQHDHSDDGGDGR